MDLRLTTLEGCGLAIGGYPRFTYDARGGGGTGRLGASGDGSRPLDFPPAALSIPPLTWRSTRILGLPLPPGLAITIEPLRLGGCFEPRSGALQLRFQARFHCRALGFYQPPPLSIDTELTTAAVQSRRHRCQGQRLDRDGLGVLVGVARVPASGDPWLDRFLGLPDEALAVLRCRLSGALSSG
ncbi:hypothetical protein [Cyanobium sp. CH-040]|uniref:hypothetical protein n=1 Tax=Cyanobium sp. CH-040 TaxID=2823708 RepID=UPI0020CDDBD5|nr:hypothetical protein [Cyanobium sp. CH-040]MCP9927023.1 hypothetical protein [Cyanobium sp. CH-040]